MIHIHLRLTVSQETNHTHKKQIHSDVKISKM